jgi:hypothetical protein
MPAEQTHIPRIQLPRSLLGRRRIATFTATYRFRLGQIVEFGEEFAAILSRKRSAMGVEIYGILIVGEEERPFRTVRGEYLSFIH